MSLQVFFQENVLRVVFGALSIKISFHSSLVTNLARENVRLRFKTGRQNFKIATNITDVVSIILTVKRRFFHG